MLEIYMFGSPRVVQGGEPMKFKRRKSVALLCYLVMKPQPIARDMLATLLWGDNDQDRARSELRVSLWDIKKVLGDDVLLVDRDTVQVNPDIDCWTDVGAFADAMTIPTQHGHADTELCVACVPAYEAAYQHYTADFLSGFNISNAIDFEQWQSLSADILRLDYATVHQRLIHAYCALGQFDDALTYAQHWAALDPLNEHTHRWQMMIYSWQDNKTAALQQYHLCEKILTNELDVTPNDETIELYQQLKLGNVPERPTIYFDVTPIESEIPYVLPPQSTPFRGRNSEIENLKEKLGNDDCRLLTITGLGGAGKTHLAINVARQLVSDFADGVFFVGLVGAYGIHAMLTDIANCLSFQFANEEDLQQQLINYLSGKNLLLILDNFEHLLEHTPFVEEVLREAPQVKLLITSRIPLRLKAEWVFTLDRMTDGAEQVFIDSAQRVDAHFTPTPDEFPVIGAICDALAGIPLAIELAATWVRVLSLNDILAEIQRNMGALTTDWRDIPERHRSLQAMFDYSWELLTILQQQALARLAIFPGSFSYHLAQAVTGVSLIILNNLLAQMLVKRNVFGRYELHPLIRQFAYGRLLKNQLAYDNVVTSFVTYITDFLAKRYSALHQETLAEAREELLHEIDSIREACELVLKLNKVDMFLDAAKTLSRLYFIQGWYQEAVYIFARFAEVSASGTRFALYTNIQHGRFLVLTGNFLEGRQLLLSLLTDHAKAFPDELAYAYQILATIEFHDDIILAKNYATTALELSRSVGDALGVTNALRLLAEITSLSDSRDVGVAYAEEALEVISGLGEIVPHAGVVHRTLANMYLQLGNTEKAVTHAEKAVEIFSYYDFKSNLIYSIISLATILNRTNDLERALKLLESAIDIAERFSNERKLMHVLYEYSTTLFHMGDHIRSIQVAERALAISRKLKLIDFEDYLKLNLADRYIEIGEIKTAVAILNEVNESLSSRGDQFALSHGLWTLGKAMRLLGIFDESYNLLCQCIQLAYQRNDVTIWLGALVDVAHIYLAKESYDIAFNIALSIKEHPAIASPDQEEALTLYSQIEKKLSKSQIQQLHVQHHQFDLESWMFNVGILSSILED